ncbi:hypothetical protein RI129_008182 [Pyrocoelia pectoralis]|uniref:Uncharacterized protein n=1 Tax=Pyrocoelia pectoralis TaxID=417401 RepID=A0AAN7V4T9_9COLE
MQLEKLYVFDAVVTWHIEHKKKIRRDTFENVSIEIEKHFRDDRFIYYKKRGPKQNPSGRLYKYYNYTKRLKKSGLLGEINNNKDADTTVLINEDLEEVADEETENVKSWLQINSSPWSDVQLNWRKTFKKRRNEILTNFCITNWP